MSLALAMLFFSGVLWADDFQFSTSAAINFKTGEYTPKLDEDSGFKFTNTTLDLGFTVFTSRYYLALNHDSTLKEDYAIVNGGTIEVDITRLDYGITAGYDLGGGFGVFVGHRIGETEEEAVRVTGTTADVISFRDKGPFAGVSYSHSFGNVGSFSASLAYANFDGEIDVRDAQTSERERTTGKTSGLSWGIKWTKGKRDGTSVSVGFRHQDYDFKDKALGFGDDQSLKQTFDTFYVQISDFFD
jgi:hypothetical protein